MTWQATVFTLFPEMFPGSLGYSLAGRALKKDIWSLETVQIRDYAFDKHKTVDDTPYGGGAGMVMRADVVDNALQAFANKPGKTVYLTPRGKPLTQEQVEIFAKEDGVKILCGRYEGVDQRVIEHHDMVEISIGDYILSGGEVASQVLLDSCVRLLPGVVSNQETHEEESFANGLLEYPHYTRPEIWEVLQGEEKVKKSVPSLLLSGNHACIKSFRLESREEITRLRRPDLWKNYKKKSEDV